VVAKQPRLEPVDYEIWSVLQQRIYETRVDNLYELKQRLIEVWSELQLNVADVAVGDRSK